MTGLRTLGGDRPFRRDGGSDSFAFVSLFTNVNNVHLPFRGRNNRYIFADRVSGRTRGACFTGCKRCPDKSVAGVRTGSVPSRSLLLTNFPYRTFSRTNLGRNFGSAHNAVFFRVRQVLTRGHPGVFLLRGIGQLEASGGKRAFRAVCSVLAKRRGSDVPSSIPVDRRTQRTLSRGLGC